MQLSPLFGARQITQYVDRDNTPIQDQRRFARALGEALRGLEQTRKGKYPLFFYHGGQGNNLVLLNPNERQQVAKAQVAIRHHYQQALQERPVEILIHDWRSLRRAAGLPGGNIDEDAEILTLILAHETKQASPEDQERLKQLLVADVLKKEDEHLIAEAGASVVPSNIASATLKMDTIPTVIELFCAAPHEQAHLPPPHRQLLTLQEKINTLRVLKINDKPLFNKAFQMQNPDKL